MCGRFAQYSHLAAIARRFAVAEAMVHADEEAPRYNIAPSSNILAVRLDEAGTRELVRLKWGLVPHWSVEPKTSYSTANARAETVDTKPAFRKAFKRHRCLIPADGWYEWEFVPGAKYKQPWYYTSQDGGPIAIAGLWDRWHQGDQVLETCTIIVSPANAVAAPVHDRMPAILFPDDWADWMDPNFPPEAAKKMLVPCPDEWVRSYKVGRAVSLAKNEGAELIVPGSN